MGLALGAAGLLAGATFAARAQDAPGGVTSVQVSDEGKQVYEQICQACHMADAKGGGSAGAMIPALANNPHLKDPNYPIVILLKGRGGMPWFTDMLTPAQMAAVITYVRSHFNNYPDPVTEAQVKKLAADPPPVPECKCTR
jgi:mono/diheme cytochrome c family protein